MIQSKLSEFLDMFISLFYLEVKKDKNDQVIHYFNKNYLINISTYNKLVVRNDENLTLIFEDEIANYQDILFMPVNIKKSKEYIYKTSHIFCIFMIISLMIRK